jgi:hypothetical protein
MKELRKLTEKEKAAGWKYGSCSPTGKTDSGSMIKDCILFKGSRESRIIGACLWGFFLIWLAGMTIALWAAYNGCTHKI